MAFYIAGFSLIEYLAKVTDQHLSHLHNWTRIMERKAEIKALKEARSKRTAKVTKYERKCCLN